MNCSSAATTRRAIWKRVSAGSERGSRPVEPVVLAREERLDRGQRDVLVRADVAGDHGLRRCRGQAGLELHRGSSRRIAAGAGAREVAARGQQQPGPLFAGLPSSGPARSQSRRAGVRP